MNHSRSRLPETTTPMGRAVDELERLQEQVKNLQESNRIYAKTLVKAGTERDSLKHWLQWALNEMSGYDMEHTPTHKCDPVLKHCEFCDKYWQAMNVAWPKGEHGNDH